MHMRRGQPASRALLPPWRACLGVGMLGERPAGSAKGRLAAPPPPPKGLLLAGGALLLGPKGLTGVLSACMGACG